MVSFLDAITCVIGRTVHALDVITSISRYDSRSNLLHFFTVRNELILNAIYNSVSEVHVMSKMDKDFLLLTSMPEQILTC